MALTVVKQPLAICLAKNPVWFQFQTTNYVNFYERDSLLTFLPWGHGGNNYTAFQFTIEGVNHDFVYKTTPSKNGSDLPINYTADYADYFNSNSFFSKYFFAFPIKIEGVDAICIQPYFKGEASQMIYNTSIASGLYLLNIRNGRPLSTKENYNLNIDVFVEKEFFNNDFKCVYRGKHTPHLKGETSIVDFDISEILKPFLSYNIPTFNQSYHTLIPNIIRRYFVKINESYGSPVVNYLPIKSDFKECLLAGINFRNYLKEPDFINTPNYNQIFNTPFILLDWESNEKTLLPNQEDYVFLMTGNEGGQNLLGPGEYAQMIWKITASEPNDSLAVTTFWKNNVAGGFVTIDMIGSTKGREIHVFPTGYINSLLKNNLETTEQDYNKIVEYEIWLELSSQQDPVFVRKFIIDHKHYYNLKQFAYTNSLGGFSTFYTTGESKKAVEINFSEFLKDNNIELTNEGKNNFRYNYNSSEIFEVNSGFKTKSEIFNIIDFLFSENKFESIQDADETGFTGRVAIDVNETNFDLYSSEDGLFSITFKYKYALINEGFNTSKRFV